MSVDGSSPLDQALRLCGELSSAHQLDLIISLAKSLKKGAGGGRGAGSRSKVAASGVPKVKKALSPGVAAWMAFVKHCKESFPERFEGVSKESEKLAIVKAIRAEDEGAYAEFAAEFKASYVPSAPGSVASEDEESEAEEAAAPPPKAKKASGAGASAKDAPKKAEPAPKPSAASPSASAAEPAKDKAAKLAALKAKASAKKPAAGGASSAASSSPAPAPKAEKKEKKAVKKAAAAEPPAEEESMKKTEILGENYWLDVKTNGLYEVGDGDSWGSWVGYYQPGEEEPIRFTDAPEDE